jgi:hypothetical protein
MGSGMMSSFNRALEIVQKEQDDTRRKKMASAH